MNPTQIAAEAADEMIRSGIIVEIWRVRVTKQIQAAIEKARKDDAWTIKDLERQRDNFKAYASRAAHTSEPVTEARIRIINFLLAEFRRPIQRWQEDEVESIIQSAIEKRCAELIGEKVALTFELEKSRAAYASEDLLDLAWGIIANAGGGDWTKESREWQDAATKWRDRYKVLPAHASEEGASNLLRDIRCARY